MVEETCYTLDTLFNADPIHSFDIPSRFHTIFYIILLYYNSL